MSYSSLTSTARILQESNQILADTSDTMAQVIADTGRLQKVLAPEKVFGLVPEMDVYAAKKSVDIDLHPQLQLLGDICEKKLQRLRRKKQELEAHRNILKSRLETAENRSPIRSKVGMSSKPQGFVSEKAAVAHLNFLRQKSSRLSYNLKQRQAKGKRANLGDVPSLQPM